MLDNRATYAAFAMRRPRVRSPRRPPPFQSHIPSGRTLSASSVFADSRHLSPRRIPDPFPGCSIAAGPSFTLSEESLLAARLRSLIVLFPLLVFALHASWLGSWLIDDAGISVAYAQNLAHGFGFVSQPGAVPVEGFSNFLWVVLLAGLVKLHLFSLVWTLKLLAVALLGIAFALLAHVGRRLGWHPLVVGAGLLLLAVQPSFVIWAVSGLENPLYACLLAGLLAVSVSAEPNPWLAGVLATAAALTRPDALLFAAAFPMIVRRWPAIVRYSPTVVVLYGGFLLWRHAYFGAWLPNTYYAKIGMTTIDPMTRLLELASLFFQTWLVAIPLILCAVMGALLDRSLRPVLIFASLGIVTFCLMPADWMGEYRFATAAILFGVLWLPAAVVAVTARMAAVPRDALRIVSVAALIWLSAGYYQRTEAFRRDPSVPLAAVRDAFGLRFNALAETLDLPHASLLAPDMGGSLLSSHLRLIDLAGLCDPVIARTRTRNLPAFYDYIFDVQKPTFIHTHTIWAFQTSFDGDPRFRRDYIPLQEWLDTWQVMAGDYVRRDAIRGKDDRLASALAILQSGTKDE